MANAIQIKYHGETLCCLDQTEVKAVEPYVFCKPPVRNVFQRIADIAYRFATGKKRKIIVGDSESSCELGTKILFKDGTWMRIKIPFMDFVDAYC
ncbi:MAG: hypothetical protein J6Q22_10195 [Prevotella sp.]|nr:hypothetical protein [Prevotella sp.]